MMPLHTRTAAARIARQLFLAAAVLLATGIMARAQDEAPEDYPPGDGRDGAFYACTACHGFKLVAAQGMSRVQWDATINLMTSKHGMPAIEGRDREIVLNYLEAAFPPRAIPSRGFQNPFIK
jgi:hypothetical protein